MEIIRLPVGEEAPLDVDCIRVEELPGSTYKLTGTALCTVSDDADSVSIVGGPLFVTIEQAEAAGMAWATHVGVERLFVSAGTLDRPLKMLEIDRPIESNPETFLGE